MKTIAAVFLGALLLALPTSALAISQTFVAQSGSDGGNCSRISPCATWQHAIDNADTGGTVTALDAGFFGTVSITKSITLDGGADHAGIGDFSTAVQIDSPTANVTLRNMTLSGQRQAPAAPADNFGVDIVRARYVRLEHVSIYDFGRAGIKFTASNPSSRLTVVNSLISFNGGYGVAAAAPTTGATGTLNRANLRNVSVLDNGAGGVSAEATGTTGVVVSVFNSLVADNAADGIRANGARAKQRISNNDINDNAQGLRVLNGGNIASWGNNRVFDNGIDGAPTVMASPK